MDKGHYHDMHMSGIHELYMHLIALSSQNQQLTHALSEFKDRRSNIYLHPIPNNSRFESVCDGLKALDFVGLLALDEAAQSEAYQKAERSSLDAQEIRAADSLTVSANGLIGEYNMARAIMQVLKTNEWDARGAKAVILGASALARAIARELSSSGVSNLSLFAETQPSAESTTSGLAVSTEQYAGTYTDVRLDHMLSEADLLIQVSSKSEAKIADEHLGPHLSFIDLSTENMTLLRKRALNLGASTLSLKDVQAQQLALSLNHMLGTQLSPAPFLDILQNVAAT